MPRAVELIADLRAFPRATRGRPPTPEWPAERALPTQVAGKAPTGDKLWNTFRDAAGWGLVGPRLVLSETPEAGGELPTASVRWLAEAGIEAL